MTIKECYEPRLDNNGNVILQPEFAASLRQFYLLRGWPIPPLLADRGRAMDAAMDAWPAEDSHQDPYEEVNRIYEQILNSGGTIADGDFAGAAKRTRANAASVHHGYSSGDAAEATRALAEYRRAHAWDRSDDSTMLRNLDLERRCRELLEASQPLPESPSEGGLSV